MQTNIIVEQEYLDFFRYSKDPKSFMFKMAGYFFLFCTISIIPVLLVMYFLQGSVSDKTYTMLGAVLQYGIIGIILFSLCLGFKTYMFVGFKRFNIKQFLLLLILLPASFVAMSFITIILGYLMPDINSSGSVFSYFDMFNLPLTLLIVAFIPSVIEELVCRGVIQGICRCRSVLCGIVVSTFCFSLMHMNLQQFAYSFIFGIILALVREFTGSIWSTIFLHFGSNAISVILMYQEFKKQTNDLDLAVYDSVFEYLSANVSFAIISVICIIICAVCLLFMDKFSSRNKNRQIDDEWPVISAGFIIGWIMCIAAMLIF